MGASLGATAVCLTATLLALALGASSARAIEVHRLSFAFDGASTPSGTFANVSGLAVDATSGDLYVADTEHDVVDRFTAAGAYVSQLDGAATPAGSFALANPAAVAVDGSAGLSAGDLYVLDAGHGVVDRFDPSGSYLGQLSETSAGPFEALLGLDVDALGDVWVYEAGGNVDEFDPTGAPLERFNTGFGTAPGLAVDSGDRVYAVRGCGCTERFDAPDAPEPFKDLGELDPGFAVGLAVERANDHVYVDDGAQVNVYDAAGHALNSFGAGELSSSGVGAVALAPDGTAYVANPGDAKVYVYEPLAIADPAVTIDPPTNVTASHATLTGTVNPQGAEALNSTSWRFEYSTDGGQSWTATAGGEAGTGGSPVAVADQLAGLLPAQEVEVRLLATNLAGSRTTSSVETFTTEALAPTASTEPVADLATTHAHLHAVVDPAHSSTAYFFEFGPSAAYGSRVPAGEPGDAGARSGAGALFQMVEGLTPGTTYHYRVVARNAAGTTAGQDETFTTLPAPQAQACPNEALRTGPSAALPDCRAYELVSPPQRNGSDAMADATREMAAQSLAPGEPMAFQFSSTGAFADAVGTGVAVDYLGIRDARPGTQGWSTHAITPPQKPILLNANAGINATYMAFSPDLDSGVFLASSPVTAEDPDVARIPNLYLRSDARVPGHGEYKLLSGCEGCSQPLEYGLIAAFQEKPYLFGHSADFEHVLFASLFALTPDTPPCSVPLTAQPGCEQSLYEYDEGVVRLASVLPDGSTLPDREAGGALVTPQHDAAEPHVMSADGRRVFFTALDDTCGCDGVFMRLDHTQTIKLNASERTPAAAPTGAQFADASVDGKTVFFTSGEPLTDDAPEGGLKLYRYEASRPDSDPHNLTYVSRAETSDGSPNTIGVSDDGSYVYFQNARQLVPGAPEITNGEGLFVWHEGAIRFIGAKPEDTLFRGVNYNLLAPRITPDGHELLFTASSGAEITGDETAHEQLYLYDAPADRTTCVSCAPPGVADAGEPILSPEVDQGGAILGAHTNRLISDDGRRVFFSTPTALVAQDTNGRIDAYEYDVPTGTVHLLSSGAGDADSYFIDANADGSDAFIQTFQRLNGWDGDDNADIYDARVGGGFPEPPPPAATCSGEGCQPAASSPPPAGEEASSGVEGPGSLTAPSPPPASHPHPTRRQQLAKALHACKKLRARARRHACEARARRRFGAKAGAR